MPFAAATQLAVTAAPPFLPVGSSPGTIQVTVEDSTGVLATTKLTASVTLTLTGPTGFSTVTKTAAAAAGVASFNLSGTTLSVAGIYTLTATASGLTSGTATMQAIGATTSLGTEAVGSTAAGQAVTFTFTSNVTVTGINVLTGGQTGQDFQLDTQNTSTCMGAQTPAKSCVVFVTFKPRVPGIRMGAVQLTNNGLLGVGASILQTTMISGLGQGPMVTYGAGTSSTVYSQSAAGASATSLAVDAAGDLYLADYGVEGVFELTNTGGVLGAVTQLTSGLPLVGSGFLGLGAAPFGPYGVAVDGAGNLFVSDIDNGEIWEIPAGGTAVSLAIPAALNLANPCEIAVDAAGNLYVTDDGNNQILLIPNENGTLNPADTSVLASGDTYSGVDAITVDSAGNVWVANYNVATVVEIPNQNGVLNPAAAVIIPLPPSAGAAGSLAGISVDAAGDVLLASNNGASVWEIPNINGVLTPSATYDVYNLTDAESQGCGCSPDAVLFDGSGNFYYTDITQVNKLSLQSATVLDFGNHNQVGVTSSSKSTTVSNPGNVALSIGTVGYDQNYPNAASSCTATLNPGSQCAFTVDFVPPAVGTATGTLTVPDNAVNQSSGNPESQTITLTGSALQGTQTITVTTPLPNTTFSSTAINLNNYFAVSSGQTLTYTATGKQTISGSNLTLTGLGSITVTASQAGNSSWKAATPVSQTFTVSQGTPAVSWVPAITPAVVVYGQPLGTQLLDASSPVPGGWTYSTTYVPAELPGVAAPPPITATLTAASDLPAATYTVVATFTPTDNVDWSTATVTQTIQVNRSQLAVVPNPVSMVFGQPIPTLTYTITGPLYFGDTLAVVQGQAFLQVVDSNGNPVTAPVVGKTYTITASTQGHVFALNYNFIAQTATLTVTPSAPPVTWAPPTSIVYGTTLAGELNGTATISGSWSYKYNGSSTGFNSSTVPVAGSYPITAQFVPVDTTDYSTFTQSITLTVTKAPLAVTPSAGNRIYGAANPAFSYTVTGFVNGDSSSVITGGTVTYSTNTTATSPVGSGYTVTAAGTLAAANYSFNYGTAGFTINPATLTVTAQNQTMEQGTTPPALTYVVTGFLNGDPATVVSGAPLVSTAANNSSPAATYPITITQGSLAAQNYIFTLVSGTITVEPNSQTITFPTPSGAGNLVFGVGSIALSATSSAGLPVTLTVTSGPGSMSGNNLVIGGAGTIVVTASQAGSGLIPAAPSVVQAFVVAQAPQTITFGALPNVSSSASPITLTATASSGLPVTFTVAAPATISGSVLTLNGATGTITVTANQAGNANIQAAPAVSQTFSVTTGYSINTTIYNDFNQQSIRGGSTLYFNSSFVATGVQNGTVLQFQNSVISFIANGTPYTLTVPNATITFSSSAASVTSTFNATTGTWQTVVPFTSSTYRCDGRFDSTDIGGGGVFLDALAYTVPATGLPGNLPSVGWSGLFTSSTSGVKVNWRWKAENYSQFSNNYNSICVKPAESTHCLWSNWQWDEAGTAEYFEGWETGAGVGDGNGEWWDWSNSTTLTLDGKTLQTITFPVSASQSSSSTLTLNATSTSGLPVTYNVISGNAWVTGNVLTVSSRGGTFVVEADQAGNNTYDPAPPVQVVIAVSAPSNNQSNNYGCGWSWGWGW